MQKAHPEKTDQALLVFRQQLGCHPHIKEDEFGRGLEVEIIAYTAPQAVGVCHPHQDVSRVQICVCTGERITYNAYRAILYFAVNMGKRQLA